MTANELAANICGRLQRRGDNSKWSADTYLTEKQAAYLTGLYRRENGIREDDPLYDSKLRARGRYQIDGKTVRWSATRNATGRHLFYCETVNE
jgi:hypothetical protein